MLHLERVHEPGRFRFEFYGARGMSEIVVSPALTHSFFVPNEFSIIGFWKIISSLSHPYGFGE